MKEPDQDDVRRVAARRRARRSSWGTKLFQQPPLEGGSQRWAWGVAGVILLLLFTFVSGVRVGKELGRPSEKKETASSQPTRAEERIPFRIGDAGKGVLRESEEKIGSPESAEKFRGKEVPEAKEQARPAGEKEAKIPSKIGSSTPLPAKAAQSPKPTKPKYALQVAALNSPEEARELVQKLKSKGYEAYAVTGTAAAKGSLHRVRIGAFHSLTEAREFAVEFEKKEKIRTIIATLQNS